MIYLIRSGAFGDVKIGVTGDALARLRHLQTSHPIKLRIVRLLDGSRDAERALHERFASHRKSGEWFAFVPDMLSADLGCADLPIPRAKRDARVDVAAPGGRYRLLIRDLLEAVGGQAKLAQAIGQHAVVGLPDEVHDLHLSALVVLARLRGIDVDLGTVIDARDEARREVATAAHAARMGGVATDYRAAEVAASQGILSVDDFEGMAARAGISMAQAFRQAGIAASTFTRWKARKTQPNTASLRRLAQVFTPGLANAEHGR